MKYRYCYKTSDGIRHEAALEAASRDAAFAALRAQGIRPIKVVAADGAKANGEMHGVRKRIVAAVACAAALAAGIAVFLWNGNRAETLQAADAARSLVSPRHQIYGDPVVMEDFERGKSDAVFPCKGDRILAWFAQPGKIACPKGTDRALFRRLDDAHAAALAQAVQSEHVAPAAGDSREVRELKQIVNGMREEMRAYLANGNGTVRSYWRRLLERTHQEMQIAERTRRELENATDPAAWERGNETLRRLGLRTIPLPHEGE